MNLKSIRFYLAVFSCMLLLVLTVGCGNSGTPAASPPDVNSGVSPVGSPQVSGKTGSPENPDELMVFAAAGTKPAVDEAAKLYKQKSGINVTVNYGGGGEVLSNMVIAKSGDIYIAPEQRFMDSAKSKGAIDNDTLVTSLAYMVPVIGVKKGNPRNIQSLEDLTQPGLKIIMGNPDTMMLGYVAPQILEKAGLYEAVKPNVVATVPQVNGIITALVMSQVDTGIIWHHFKASSPDDIDIIWIPPEYVTGIGEIQAAVVTYSKNAGAARKFIDFLTSAECREIFRKNGYIVDREEADKFWAPE